MWSRRNKSLTIILFTLVALILIDNFESKKSQNRLFKDQLITTDTSEISKIEFYPRSEKNKMITLERNGNKWSVKQNSIEYEADIDKINEILTILANLRPVQVMGKSSDAWKEYGVTDTSGLNVFITNKKNKHIAHLIIGKIASSQQANTGLYQQQAEFSTYVRIENDKNVYLVPQLLAITFVDDINQFRNNNLTPTTNNVQIKRIDFNYRDTSQFSLWLNASQWFIDSTKADSMNCERYVRSLQKLESINFADSIEWKNLDTLATVHITYFNNRTITIQALGDTTVQYIWSSYNPKSLFNAQFLYKRLFKKRSYFAYKQ